MEKGWLAAQRVEGYSRIIKLTTSVVVAFALISLNVQAQESATVRKPAATKSTETNRVVANLLANEAKFTFHSLTVTRVD